MNKKLILKIIVPIIMISIVFIIWLTQNSKNEHTTSENLKFPLHISSVNLEILKSHNMPIIIDFGATECIPCKEMAPVLESLNAQMQDIAIIQFVDVWKYPSAAYDFPVQIIPTQIFINSDGTPYIPSESITIEFQKYADSTTGEHVFTAHQGGLTEEEMKLILKDMGVE